MKAGKSTTGKKSAGNSRKSDEGRALALLAVKTIQFKLWKIHFLDKQASLKSLILIEVLVRGIYAKQIWHKPAHGIIG